MAQGHRPDRVGEQIRDLIGEMLARGDVHDPGIGFITLTRVQVTSDLQIARVFYTTLGDPKARKDTARALERATPFLRRQVAGRLRLRRAPELEFRFDETIEHQDRLEQILRDLHQEEAQRALEAESNPKAQDPLARQSSESEGGNPKSQVPERDDDDHTGKE